MYLGITNQDHYYCEDVINCRNKVGSQEHIKQSIGGWVNKFKPKFFLTITAKEIKSDNGFRDTRWLVGTTEFIRNIKRLLHWTQCSIFGRNYVSNGRHLDGIGCLERQSNYNPHVHLLIKPNSECDYRDFRNQILRKSEKIPMLSQSGIDVQKIKFTEHDRVRLGDYIAKNIHLNSGLITLSKGELG